MVLVFVHFSLSVVSYRKAVARTLDTEDVDGRIYSGLPFEYHASILDRIIQNQFTRVPGSDSEEKVLDHVGRGNERRQSLEARY